MSKITLEPNNSGSGTFTIAAPNSNNNRQIDLPDLAGTVLTDATDLEPQVKTATNATGSAPVYACRAWVNFDGTGTVSIRASGNVSSITDTGTGRFTVNLTTAMPDANYGVAIATGINVSNNQGLTVGTKNTSNVSVFSYSNVSSLVDSDFCSVSIFR